LPSELKNKLDLFAIQVTNDLDLDEEDIIDREFDSMIKNFYKKKREKIKNEIAEKIAEAEVSGDREKIKELMKELQSAMIKKD